MFYTQQSYPTFLFFDEEGVSIFFVFFFFGELKRVFHIGASYIIILNNYLFFIFNQFHNYCKGKFQLCWFDFGNKTNYLLLREKNKKKKWFLYFLV